MDHIWRFFCGASASPARKATLNLAMPKPPKLDAVCPILSDCASTMAVPQVDKLKKAALEHSQSHYVSFKNVSVGEVILSVLTVSVMAASIVLGSFYKERSYR